MRIFEYGKLFISKLWFMFVDEHYIDKLDISFIQQPIKKNLIYFLPFIQYEFKNRVRRGRGEGINVGQQK